MKVTKIVLDPSRTIDLGPGNGYAKLSASIEIELDKPAAPDSEEVKKAFDEGRRLIRREFKLQNKPYEIFTK